MSVKVDQAQGALAQTQLKNYSPMILHSIKALSCCLRYVLQCVQVVTWVPQNDVLAHPNLRVFLSHVGINSMYEVSSDSMFSTHQQPDTAMCLNCNACDASGILRFHSKD